MTCVLVVGEWSRLLGVRVCVHVCCVCMSMASGFLVGMECRCCGICCFEIASGKDGGGVVFVSMLVGVLTMVLCN